MTRLTAGSFMSCSAAAADPRTAGEGKKTGSAPVARASRSMRRVVLTWTPGVPPEELDDPGGHAGAEGGQLLDRGQPGGRPGGQPDDVAARERGLQVGGRRGAQRRIDLRIRLPGVDDDALGEPEALLQPLLQPQVGPLRGRDHGADNALLDGALEQARDPGLGDVELGGYLGLPLAEFVVHPGDAHHQASLSGIGTNGHSRSPSEVRTSAGPRVIVNRVSEEDYRLPPASRRRSGPGSPTVTRQ